MDATIFATIVNAAHAGGRKVMTHVMNVFPKSCQLASTSFTILLQTLVSILHKPLSMLSKGHRCSDAYSDAPQS